MRYSAIVVVFALLVMGCSGGAQPAIAPAIPATAPAVDQPVTTAPATPAAAPAMTAADMQQYKCSVCGYIYDPAANNHVPFSALPADWKCPRCGVTKDKFKPVV